MEELWTQVNSYLATFGIEILIAIGILIIGRWMAGVLSGIVERGLLRAKLDKSLVGFIRNLCYFALLTFVVMAALGRLGIETTSFIAVLGAAGLAVGLALKDTLANFAAGVMIILFQPFRIGDVISTSGQKGKVQEIQIFNTILTSPDNAKIIIPNSHVTGSNIVNFTCNGTRRVDMTVGVSYDDDIPKAKEVIRQVLASNDKILADPAPVVAVNELGDSSVNFVVRPWVATKDYWDVYFDIQEKLKIELENAGLTIPFPQRDLHVLTEAEAKKIKGK